MGIAQLHRLNARWSRSFSVSPMLMASFGFFSSRKRQKLHVSSALWEVASQPKFDDNPTCATSFYGQKKIIEKRCVWLCQLFAFFFLRIYFSPPLFNCVFHVVILCIVSIHKFCQCKAWRLRFSFGHWHGMGLCSCSKLSDWQLPSNLEQVQFHI